LLGSLVLAGAYPLVDPDEGRNAEIAREMATSGDLIITHLAGMPYLDKPPGLFWGAALAIRLLGATPRAVRLPSALAACATLIVLGRLAARHMHRHLGLRHIDGALASGHVDGPLAPGRTDNRFVLRAVGLLAAAPLFAALSAYVIFDMALTLCVTIVWTELAEEIRSGPNRTRRIVMFAAVTAGLLIKGPVMIAWAVGGSLVTALLLRGREPLRWLAWWPGWLMVLGIAGGWFVLACRRYPEYPHYAFIEESLERVTTGSFHRQQPFWFVPVVLAVGALPWSLTTPWGQLGRGRQGNERTGNQRTGSAQTGSAQTRDAGTGSARTRSAVTGPATHLRQNDHLDRASRVAIGFALFAVLFFSASRSKLVTYLLPVVPMMAWLAAEAWSDAGRIRRGAWNATLMYAALAVAFAFGIPALRSRALVSIDDPALIGMSVRAAHQLAIACGILAVTCVCAALVRWRDVALVASLLFTPLVFVIGGPALARYAATQSGAPLAQAIARRADGKHVRFESCYSPGTDFMLG
ncbi:MAG TPA: hypothetical protein VFG86_15785, partial [Chloroflexota bacterium]|nr:hypothetical protein [Chloroflexota bacterium]